MQDYLGIPNPCSGGVFEGGVHQSGVRLSASTTICASASNARSPCGSARDLEPGAAPFTAETLSDAVAAFMPAIEIVDDRYADWRTTDTPTLIADDFFAAGCVLGLPVEAIGAPAEMIGVTTINGWRRAGGAAAT